MCIKNLLKKSSVLLALFLLSFAIFYILIKLFGYTFIPFNGPVINIFLTGIIIFLTINGIKNGNDKTDTTLIFAAALPLIALIYLILKSVSSDIGGENHSLYLAYLSEKSIMIYVIHACITFVCSMMIFFLCWSRKTVRIVMGIIYNILLAFICYIFLSMIAIFSDFGKNTVIKSELSPNAKYLAEIIDVDSGLLGGSTVVDVTKQNMGINLFIGELKKDPKRIYQGRWGESFDMTLRWETDEIIFIDGGKYIIEQ